MSAPLLLLRSMTLGLCPALMLLSLYAMTLLYKSQRHWHPLFYLRNLRGPVRHFDKSSYSSRAWATRLSLRKRPTLQYYCNRSRVSYNFLPCYTRYNWGLRKLACSFNTRCPRHGFPPFK